jgi:DNA-directed RNA polymerase subunit RPC12/RpoP
MKLHCQRCGKVVSTEVPDDAIVRAFVECPECIEEDASRCPTCGNARRILKNGVYISCPKCSATRLACPTCEGGKRLPKGVACEKCGAVGYACRACGSPTHDGPPCEEEKRVAIVMPCPTCGKVGGGGTVLVDDASIHDLAHYGGRKPCPKCGDRNGEPT